MFCITAPYKQSTQKPVKPKSLRKVATHCEPANHSVKSRPSVSRCRREYLMCFNTWKTKGGNPAHSSRCKTGSATPHMDAATYSTERPSKCNGFGRTHAGSQASCCLPLIRRFLHGGALATLAIATLTILVSSSDTGSGSDSGWMKCESSALKISMRLLGYTSACAWHRRA